MPKLATAERLRPLTKFAIAARAFSRSCVSFTSFAAARRVLRSGASSAASASQVAASTAACFAEASQDLGAAALASRAARATELLAPGHLSTTPHQRDVSASRPQPGVRDRHTRGRCLPAPSADRFSGWRGRCHRPPAANRRACRARGQLPGSARRLVCRQPARDVARPLVPVRPPVLGEESERLSRRHRVRGGWRRGGPAPPSVACGSRADPGRAQSIVVSRRCQ